MIIIGNKRTNLLQQKEKMTDIEKIENQETPLLLLVKNPCEPTTFSLEKLTLSTGYAACFLYTAMIVACAFSTGKLKTASEYMDGDPAIQIVFFTVLSLYTIGSLSNLMANRKGLLSYVLLFTSSWFTLCTLFISCSLYNRAHVTCISIGVFFAYLLTIVSCQWRIASAMTILLLIFISEHKFALSELLLFELVIYRAIDAAVPSRWCVLEIKDSMRGPPHTSPKLWSVQ
jgi:hypothetical protein